MPQPLDDALAELRPLLLDHERLVRAVAAGRRRGETPRWTRVELRPVDLKPGRCLQVVTHDGGAPLTRNLGYDEGAPATVDELLAAPFGNWHVETTDETVQLRVTKKGAAQVHRSVGGATQNTEHDRPPRHLVDPGDPMFDLLAAGADKRRQVDAFVRVLDGVVVAADLPTDRPLRVVDLGCGNAYLTFAAFRYLAVNRAVEMVGVDLRDEARERNTRIADELGWSPRLSFVAGSIVDAPVTGADVVLALHACDTATDDALAVAVRWRASLVLAAPCCHHDVQRQLKAAPTPAPYALLLRHPILREHFGDVLTDGLRAALLRRLGYRVEVLQFVASQHTPRNTMIKAVRTDAPVDPVLARQYEELVGAWGVTPYLQSALDDVLR